MMKVPKSQITSHKSQILRSVLLLLLLITIAIPSPTQTQATPPAAANATPAAKPGDVDSLEHILAAVYDVISGPPGTRDWDRFRSLFYPGARLVPSRRDSTGKVGA